jgi:hypothetical protein
LWSYYSPNDLLWIRDISPAAVTRGGSTAFSAAAMTYGGFDKQKLNNSLEVTLMFLPDNVNIEQLGWLTIINKQPWHMRLLHFSSDAPSYNGSGEGLGDINMRMIQASIGTGWRVPNSPFAFGTALYFLSQRTYVYDKNFLMADLSAIFAPPKFPLKFSLTARNLGFDLTAITKTLYPSSNQIIGSTPYPLYVSSLPVTFCAGVGATVSIFALEGSVNWSPYPLPETNEVWTGGNFDVAAGLGVKLFTTTDNTALTLNVGWRTRGTADSVFSGGIFFDLTIGELVMRWVYAIEPTPGFDPIQHAGLILRFQ